jgi:hypothetical protein
MGSGSWFRKGVARLRVEYQPKDPADRIEYTPGDQMQCDLWFPGVPIPIDRGDSAKLCVLVMVASYFAQETLEDGASSETIEFR